MPKRLQVIFVLVLKIEIRRLGKRCWLQAGVATGCHGPDAVATTRQKEQTRLAFHDCRETILERSIVLRWHALDVTSRNLDVLVFSDVYELMSKKHRVAIRFGVRVGEPELDKWGIVAST